MLTITDNEKSIILGKLIQDERKQQKKSAEVVASLSGISQQYLSEIERGKKNIPHSSINCILNTLNLAFDYDISLIEQADQILDSIIDAYLNFDRARMLSRISALVSGHYKYSFAYPYYVAGIFARKCLLEKKKNILFSKPITNNSKINMFLYLCIGKTLLHDQKEKASSLIQKGLSLYTPYADHPSVAALYGTLLYDLAGIYEHTNQLFDALSLNQKALDIMSKLYYTSFALSIELNIAIIYSKMGQIQLSTRKNLQVLQLTNNNRYTDMRNAAKFNLASNYLIAGEYETCILISSELLPLLNENPAYLDIYYLLAFSYYMLGDYANAKKYCASLLAENDTARFSYKLAQTLLEGLSTQFDTQSLKILFEETMRGGDQSDVEIVFRLLIAQLKKEQLFQEALEYYDLYTSYRFFQNNIAPPWEM